MTTTSAEFDGRWDLSDLFDGPDDPAIEARRSKSRELGTAFAQRYRGRVAELSPSELADAFRGYEEVCQATSPVVQFASLRFSVATGDQSARADRSAAEGFQGEMDQMLAFFNVELVAMGPERLEELAAAPELTNYGHYIGYQLLFAPHTLSVDSEETIALKNVTGKTAWTNLYTQITGGLRFKVVEDGEEKLLPRPELTPYLLSADRGLREQASKAIPEGFAPHRDVLTYVFNTLFEDHRLEMDKRGYEDVLDYTILRDDLPSEVVHTLLDTTTSNFDIVHRYQA
ncbi:MAG: hypothetical protein VX498_00165, partial [Myxococcota bacterium]|nr:hypothetical protein [Myxococcota bacterium]